MTARGRALVDGSRRTLRLERARPSASRTIATPHDLDREGEVAHHLTDHGQLLEVLLSEVDPTRSGHGQQFRHDARHPVEVSGSRGAFEDARRGRAPTRWSAWVRDSRATSRRATARRGSRRRGLRPARDRPRAFADSARGRRGRRTGGDSRTIVATTTSPWAFAASKSDAWPACSAPIVGTKSHAATGSSVASRSRRATPPPQSMQAHQAGVWERRSSESSNAAFASATYVERSDSGNRRQVGVDRRHVTARRRSGQARRPVRSRATSTQRLLRERQEVLQREPDRFGERSHLTHQARRGDSTPRRRPRGTPCAGRRARR